MLNYFQKIFPIALCAVLIFSGISAMGYSPVTPASQTNSTYSFIKQVPVFIENNLSVASPAYFDERITVNSSLYYPYENANLSNVVFTYSNLTTVPSWLQSGNSNTANNTVYWLKLNSSIPAYSTLTVYMSFESTSSFAFNNVTTGEAPGLSSTYGQFDNGASIFLRYDNFSGNTLNPALWVTGGSGNITVNNGITFSADSYIQSIGAFPSPSYAEAYGIMNAPSTIDSTTYFLGGVGFSNAGLDGASPVVTSGWTEGNVNGLGMSMWNGSGTQYVYSISKAISPNSYHVFGTGFINSTFLTTTINGTIENQTTANFGSGPYNIVLGFQANDFPTVNHFSWIRDVHPLSNGLEMPFSLNGYNVTLKENGLPAGTPWTISFPSVSGARIGGTYFVNNSTVYLPNGTYKYNISTSDPSYHPSSGSGTFTVSGSTVTVNFTFLPTTYNASFIAKGLPASSAWSVEINGTLYNATVSLLNVSLMNGTYNATIYNSANGYQAYPSGFMFSINGNNTTFPVLFESPANQTYARAISTIQPGERTIYSGYYYTSTHAFTNLAGAIDQKDGLMFNTMLFDGNVTVTNLTTGTFMTSLDFGVFSGFPLYPYYDQNSGYLFIALGNGSIAMVNTTTLSVVKFMDAAYLADTYAAIVPSETPNLLYALGYTSNSSGTYNIPVVYSFYTNGTVKGNTTFPAVNSSSVEFFSNPVTPYTYGNDILTFNNSNIVILNMTTGAESLIPVPLGYGIGSLFPYGTTGDYILGNIYQNTTLMFSPSNMTIFGGPLISGFATSGFYDSLNHLEYILTYPTVGIVGNLTVMDPTNNTVIAKAPELIPSLSMSFDPANQNLYAVDYYVFSDAVQVYSTQRASPIDFSENSLPSGDVWYVNITGGPSSGPIAAGSNYIVYLTAGNYTYTVASNDRRFTPPTSASITVPDTISPESISVLFTPVEYNVTVTETGLPAGTAWAIQLNSGAFNANESSTGSTNVVSVINGTYSYKVLSSDQKYSANVSSGSITVSGAPVFINVTFHLVTYTVTFTETGLPSGTTWYANLSNGLKSGPVTASSFTFNLQNGSYTYSISTSNKIYAPSQYSGTFVVNGANQSVANIKFAPVTYTVTFKETGLSNGTSWSVTVNGAKHSGTGTTITVDLSNGSYSYSVGNVTGYSVVNQTGTVNVSGASASVNIAFNANSAGGGFPVTYIAVIAGVIIAVVVIGGAFFFLRKKPGK